MRKNYLNLQKISKYLIFVLALFYFSITNASSLPFTDIAKTDNFYSNLEYLYNMGIIKDNPTHKFNPSGLIRRDEFVGIVVGVGCKDCISPSIEDIIKYNTLPFIDVEKNNPYFYCISSGKDDGIIKGYLLDSSGKYTCQNKKTFTETPFCPENNITRIEAVTVLLRTAKIWNDELNSNISRTTVINDVDDKWYGFAKKGIETGILKANSENKVFPNEYINKGEFINMAYKIFGINSCELKSKQKSDLSSEIKIFDKENLNSCSGKGTPSNLTNSKNTIYDFFGYTENVGDFSYIWEFTNLSTKEIIIKEGKCLNDFDLKTNGKWIVKLTIKDNSNGKKSTSYSEINISNNKSGISANILGNPIYGSIPLKVDFSSIVGGGDSNYTYNWDFGDNNNSSLKNPENIYLNPGVYSVILRVTDESVNEAVASIQIEVAKNLDSDNDGTLDKNDLCPLVFGPASNSGCPIVKENSKINTNQIQNKCLQDKIVQNGFINAKLSCTSCPCDFSINFNAELRTCDIIFPAIISKDETEIFSRGAIFNID
ncbi:PKD domain-containing protein [Candidatus Gracilibacteria bacterium]|nr:PKD domain-containing protein [Candidatus Gracilibacteria bacterium]